MLQIAAEPGRRGHVLDHLFSQAFTDGAIAVSGRVDARDVQTLTDRHCLLHRRGPWVLVSARHPELLRPFETGEASFTPSTASGVWASDRRTSEIRPMENVAIALKWVGCIGRRPAAARRSRGGGGAVGDPAERVLRAAARNAECICRRIPRRSRISNVRPVRGQPRGGTRRRGAEMRRAVPDSGRRRQPARGLPARSAHELARRAAAAAEPAGASGRHSSASRVHVGNIARSGVGSEALDLILERVLPRYPRLSAMVVLVGASDVLRWLEVGAPATPPAAGPRDRCLPQPS